MIETWLRPGKFKEDVLKERHHDLDNFKVDNPEALEKRKKWIREHCKDFDWFFKECQNQHIRSNNIRYVCSALRCS